MKIPCLPEASIVLQGETDIVLDRVQGTVSLTNLNTTQVFTVSSFEGNIARASILRGLVLVLVEGTAQYHRRSGKTYIRMFRASTDYVGLEKEEHNEAMLNINLDVNHEEEIFHIISVLCVLVYWKVCSNRFCQDRASCYVEKLAEGDSMAKSRHSWA